MGDEKSTQNISGLQSLKWPYSNKYFVPELMNAEGALTLLDEDTKFHEPDSKSSDSLTVLEITKKGTRESTLSTSENSFDAKLHMSDLERGDTRIIFIPQNRIYPGNSTFNTYKIKRSTWLKILSMGQVIPDAVEVLHENNGGWAVHTSDCSDVNSEFCSIESSDGPDRSQSCAYHIWLKPRPWWNDEHFIYARHDFHSRKNFLLVAGTSISPQLKRLSTRFENMTTSPHLFSILLALTTSWTKDLEYFVWRQDFATLRLESDTGWSTVGHTQLRPLPPAKLALRKDLVVTKDALGHAFRASESFNELFTFLSKKVHSLPILVANRNPSGRSDQLEDVFLQQSIRQWHQKQQANALIARIDAQWNAVNALIAQHNNGLNYQIATDSRTDTTIMRRISFVTIAFLPATFLATFFSMIFFNNTSGRITVSPRIWIYVVCVVPVTLIIAWQSSTLGLKSGLSRIWKKEECEFGRPKTQTTRETQA